MDAFGFRRNWMFQRWFFIAWMLRYDQHIQHKKTKVFIDFAIFSSIDFTFRSGLSAHLSLSLHLVINLSISSWPSALAIADIPTVSRIVFSGGECGRQLAHRRQSPDDDGSKIDGIRFRCRDGQHCCIDDFVMSFASLTMGWASFLYGWIRCTLHEPVAFETRMPTMCRVRALCQRQHLVLSSDA